jgi:DNA-binding NtrC family response regulator
MKTKRQKILLIDDDISLSTVISHQLQGMGFEVSIANSGREGIKAALNASFDLALLDLQMPDMSGMEVLKQIRLQDQEIVIIMITAYGTVENAVETCQKGADDYLTKPFAKEQLRFAIEKALRMKSLERDNQRLLQELSDKYRFGNIVTHNKNMKELLQLAGKAARSDAGVLIMGESGTGKELLARAIHHNSPRSDKPFVAVNCPSIPESLIESELFGHEKGSFTGAIREKPGKFELAHEGTILLDEVGDLRPDLQAKLLRVLQEHEIERVGGLHPIAVDVRIIAATNKDLADLVKQGKFREDLYYRLNVIPLWLPPLRQRKDDIPLLAARFLQKYSKRKIAMQPDFLQRLSEYDWPGNIRELENAIQRALVICAGDQFTSACLCLPVALETAPPVSPDGNPTLEQIERDAILAALNASNWNQSKAARQLGIPRHVLIYRMKKLVISQGN